MLRRIALMSLLAFGIGGIGWHVRGDEPSAVGQGLAGEEPVMIEVTDRDLPSDEEWAALHEDVERSSSGGGLADFGTKKITYMNTRYFGANPAEGTLASYGKMGADQRYDRFGHIQGVEFDVDQNSWKQRYVLNAAALLKLAGSRFMEYAGIGVDAAADKKAKIEVTFVGTNVPKDEAIRRLNADIQALEYFDALQQNRAKNDKKSIWPFKSDAPPAPKVVLANVVMLDGNFSKAMDASVDGKLHSRILNDGIELKVKKTDGEETTLLSPVVRCYRTYGVEFKKDAGGRTVRVPLTDAQGNVHQVPQVFDLTPDL